MQRSATRLVVVGAGVLAARALAPKLHAHALAACEHMFEEMPDSFPPKRMLHGIEEIRVNSARAVALLEHTTEPEGVGETVLR